MTWPMTLIQRRGTYSLRKRIPRRFAEVEAREFVHVSLKTDSRSEAEDRAKRAWAQMIEGWEARLPGDDRDAERRFEMARNIAQRLGFRYVPMSNVAELPREEFFRRVEAAGADPEVAVFTSQDPAPWRQPCGVQRVPGRLPAIR